MSIPIADGGGTNPDVRVSKNGQLQTISESHEIQFQHSLKNEASYQIEGDFAVLNNSTHTILSLQNTHANKIIVVTFMRMQMLDFAGGTSVPNVLTYFELGFDRTRASGGTLVTANAANMNRLGAASAPTIVAYDNNPTMTGTIVPFDRWYVEAEGKEQVYNKQGALILGQDDSVEIRAITDHTSGVARARITFMQIDPSLLT